MKAKTTLRHFLALAGSSLLAMSYSHADTRNWDGDTSASWSDAANWDTAPADSLTTDIANFNLATYGGNPVFAPDAGTTSINGVTIGAGNGAMTLTTTNLSIGASGISIANGAAAFTTTGDVTLGANQSWLNHSSSLFSVSGGTISGDRTLTVGGTGDTTISSVISGNSNGRLVKSGTGTLTLGATNTYSGYTTVSGGELILDYSTNDDSKLADVEELTLAGGSLVLKGGSHTELVSSTTLSEFYVNSISRDGGSAKINLGPLEISGARNNAALAISEDNLATTTTANASGILLQGRVTIGSHFGANAEDVDGNIVAYSGYTSATTAGGGALTVVNQLTGGGTMAADLDSYALRIVNSGSSDVLDLGSSDLEMTNNGSLLYAGGGDNNYTINGTSGWVGVDGFGQTFNLYVVDGATLILNAEVGRNRPKFLKSGAGTLVFGGDNSLYDAYVMEGVLRVTHSGGLGDTTPSTVQSGAALELANDISIGAEPLNLDGNGISNGGALRNQGGTNSFAGAITIGTSGARINADASTSLTLTGGIVTAASQDVTIGGAGDTTVSTTAISGAGSLIKDGNGTLTLSATNTYSGDTTVEDGTLALGDGTNNAGLSDFGTLSVATGAVLDLDFSGGSPDAVLLLNLGGSPMVAGQYGHTDSGATNGGAGVGFYDAFFAPNTGIINNLDGNTTSIGALFWDGGSSNIGTDGDAVSDGGSGTWDTTIQNWDVGFTGHVSWNNANLDTAYLGGGGGTITLGDSITAGGITSSSTYTISGSDTLTFDVASGTPVIDNPADLTIDAPIAGNDGLQKDGGGKLYLSNNSNSFTGGIVFNSGSLVAMKDAAPYTGWGSGTVTINGGTIEPSSYGEFTTGNNTIWNANFSLYRGVTGTTTWNHNGNVTLGNDVTLNAPNSTFHLIIDGSIGETGGSRSLKIDGGMTCTMNQAGTYSGGTNSSANGLNINHSQGIGTGPLTIESGTLDNTSGGAITLSTNNAQNWNTNFTFTGTNDLNMGTGAVTMNANRTVTVAAGTFTVGGAIGGGSRQLTKAGNGTLVLGGANSYSNTTTVSAGTLALVGGSQNSAITVNNGATLGFTLGSTITSTKSLTLNAGHSVKVTGTPTLTSYTLMTAAGGITGTPNLNPAITGYELVVDGNDLKLNSTGAASPYDTWSGGAAFGDDANGDGVGNGLAFLLGAANPNVSALDKLPTVTESAGGLVLTFQMLSDTANGDATLAIEHSNTLANGSWTAVQVPYSSGTVGDIGFNITGTGPLNVTATIPVSKAAGGKLFGRLKAENP